MDKQGPRKKTSTLVSVSVLTATLASLLMITSNVFVDISLAYATTAADASTQLPLPTADAKGDLMEKDSTQLAPPISDAKGDQMGEDSTQLPDELYSQLNEQPDCIVHCYNVQDDTQ